MKYLNTIKHTLSLLLVCFACAMTVTVSAATSVVYYHNDALGSPIAATDDAGEVLWREDYAPYGEKLSDDVGAFVEKVGYTGHRYDNETGLVYAGARMYDPSIGRFMGIDPVGALAAADNPVMFNRYAYGNNNPYKYVDPDGELPFLIPVLIFVAKEVAAEVASQATGGATDFLSVRRSATKVGKFAVNKLAAGVHESTKNAHKYVTKGGVNKVDDVIKETLSGKGNITSKHTLNSDQALDAGLKHLGPGYKEIGKPGSGVFRSADGTNQFRIDNNSLSGNHAPNVPHFHLETYKAGARKPTTNNHIPLVD